MALLAQLQGVKLRTVPADTRCDRSAANLGLSGSDVLEDEASRWKYFFEAGCTGWFEGIKSHTFRSTFVELRFEEAEVIVKHWQDRQRAIAAAEAAVERGDASELDLLLEVALAKLQQLRGRLQAAVETECEASTVGLAFVKLSTRSPKDSRKALSRAETAYRERLASSSEVSDDNSKWKVLSEEVTRAGAVSSVDDALALLLDSERVFEDLEYALRGPPGSYDMSLVARAWDPRLTLQSEFRGIAWNGQLTCLCQYFHPLCFPELAALKDEIELDCRNLFSNPEVTSTVRSLGGNCIIDFAWLGPGSVLIVELNPFDGVCLGTFPASTGLFLWEDPGDQAIMRGDAPFEFRIREHPLPSSSLKAQCNPDWRRIIYNETVLK